MINIYEIYYLSQPFVMGTLMDAKTFYNVI